MEPCCGNCQWWSGQDKGFWCRFPLPIWLMREAHDPQAGHGALASLMDPNTTDCPCFTPREETGS